jgi:hypothetical protein
MIRVILNRWRQEIRFEVLGLTWFSKNVRHVCV